MSTRFQLFSSGGSTMVARSLRRLYRFMPGKKLMRRLLPLIGLVALLPALGCTQEKAQSAEMHARARPVAAPTAVVVERELPSTLLLAGTLKANQESELAANGAGRVMRTMVERGSYVREGRRWCSSTCASAQLSECEAKANVERPEQRRARGQLCARNQRLFDSGAISSRSWIARQPAARPGGELGGRAETRAHLAAKTLCDATVRAPFSGMVSERYVAWASTSPATRVAHIVEHRSVAPRADRPRAEHRRRCKEGRERGLQGRRVRRPHVHRRGEVHGPRGARHHARPGVEGRDQQGQAAQAGHVRHRPSRRRMSRCPWCRRAASITEGSRRAPVRGGRQARGGAHRPARARARRRGGRARWPQGRRDRGHAARRGRKDGDARQVATASNRSQQESVMQWLARSPCVGAGLRRRAHARHRSWWARPATRPRRRRVPEGRLPRRHRGHAASTAPRPRRWRREITDKIEEAVNTISGIDELRSQSTEGVSQVFITFILEKDGRRRRAGRARPRLDARCRTCPRASIRRWSASSIPTPRPSSTSRVESDQPHSRGHRARRQAHPPPDREHPRRRAGEPRRRAQAPDQRVARRRGAARARR